MIFSWGSDYKDSFFQNLFVYLFDFENHDDFSLDFFHFQRNCFEIILSWGSNYKETAFLFIHLISKIMTIFVPIFCLAPKKRSFYRPHQIFNQCRS